MQRECDILEGVLLTAPQTEAPSNQKGKFVLELLNVLSPSPVSSAMCLTQPGWDHGRIQMHSLSVNVDFIVSIISSLNVCPCNS